MYRNPGQIMSIEIRFAEINGDQYFAPDAPGADMFRWQRSNLLVQKGSRQQGPRLFESNMATSGTITGDTPEMLKPLLDEFQATRAAMQEDLKQDPVPEVFMIFYCSELLLALSTLSDEELHRNQALARESSRQLTLLFADKSQSFTATPEFQVGKEEADQVHKMLEEFRDEVNEEKVIRRMNLKRAASEGSWSCVSAASPRAHKNKGKDLHSGHKSQR
eukprot:Skav205991  [mRNA]  locus=scaffold2084:79376:92702:+ [translate_table: standard]